MSILVLTHTTDAAERLSSALSRRGATHTWATEFSESTEPPLVAVVDSELDNHLQVLARLADWAPWCRRYLVGGHAPDSNTHVVEKPFDAAALAELLVHESEMVRLSRRQQFLIGQAHDLASLVQNSFEAIIGLDAQGRVMSWNPGAESVYGYTEAEMLGTAIDTLDLNRLKWPELAPGEKHACERQRRSKTGQELRVLVSRSRVAHASVDSELAFSEVSLDLTEKALLEKQLEHSARLAHLGRIAATMSHEINNPLAVIRSCTDWLSTHPHQSGTPEFLEVLDDLRLANERITSYVSQMSGFVRRDTRACAVMPISATLDCALRLMRPRASDKRVSIVMGDLSGVEEPITQDPAKLTHAIVNLVANAIDAASSGGRSVCVSVTAREDWLDVCVEDDGPGIDPAIEPHLFEPFSTTKAYGEGTGLGLALTREVMREHHGTAKLSNRRQGGAVGVLSLPRSSGRQSHTNVVAWPALTTDLVGAKS